MASVGFGVAAVATGTEPGTQRRDVEPRLLARSDVGKQISIGVEVAFDFELGAVRRQLEPYCAGTVDQAADGHGRARFRFGVRSVVN